MPHLYEIHVGDLIKILTYKDHPYGKEIWDRYLYLAAYILSFPAEDVLGTDTFEVDEKIITAGNFRQKSRKNPRKRTQKYKKLLQIHKIAGGSTSSQTLWERDYLLAAKLIWSINKALYAYLYQVKDVSVEPILPLSI